MDLVLTLIFLVFFWWMLYRWVLPRLGMGG